MREQNGMRWEGGIEMNSVPAGERGETSPTGQVWTEAGPGRRCDVSDCKSNDPS